MKTPQIIQAVDFYLRGKGITHAQDYIWSLQGPTLIHLGEPNPFNSLSREEVTELKRIGALFLVEPY